MQPVEKQQLKTSSCLRPERAAVSAGAVVPAVPAAGMEMCRSAVLAMSCDEFHPVALSADRATGGTDRLASRAAFVFTNFMTLDLQLFAASQQLADRGLSGVGLADTTHVLPSVTVVCLLCAACCRRC